MLHNLVSITECPRDAMQGIHAFIPTEKKIEYLNALLACQFSRLDFGSFVSPKAIPQLRDTEDLLPHLNLGSTTQLLAIIANEKGVEKGLCFEQIAIYGYPFSVSEQFQIRNTNVGIKESKSRLRNIALTVSESKRTLLVYLSMGFGNPYGDPWSTRLVLDYAKELYETLGISHFALADTIGCANPDQIRELFTQITHQLPNVEMGVHLHALPENAKALMTAALKAGCRNFDTALLGKGGCPMANNELTGNLNTETLLSLCTEKEMRVTVDPMSLEAARQIARNIFTTYS
ncbi:MAG: hydroxymethylglutaryl-CoA lyase [Bacteroidetes bacterium]|nr:hydroxymethylglutaryl-CoA lyase [Bacteroidota bacterium]MBM3424446.1 hydroxymethylglutaryl-CoA lyase [Bacteroidota bacterium]